MRKKYKILITIFLLLIICFLLVSVKEPDRSFSTVLYSKENRLLGAKIAKDEQWRFPELDSVPYKFEKSILYFEDQYFYKHPGVNPVSLFRATIQNIKAKKIRLNHKWLSRVQRREEMKNYFNSCN